MQKIVSALVIAAAMLSGLAYGADLRRAEVSSVPRVSDVLPDALPLDMSDAPSLAISEGAKVEVIDNVTTWSRVWVCGEPESLENDSVQTVRRCEWR